MSGVSVNQSNRPRVSVEAASIGKVYNVSVTSANTEFSQLLSNNTKQFTISVRDGGAKMQLAFNTGQTGIVFKRLGKGVSYTADQLNFSGTLYFECSSTCIVEIIEWS